MRQVLQQSAIAYRQLHVESTLPVLWEKASAINAHLWQLSGLTNNYLRVRSFSPTPCRNQVMTVRITGIGQDGLIGEILPI